MTSQCLSGPGLPAERSYQVPPFRPGHGKGRLINTQLGRRLAYLGLLPCVTFISALLAFFTYNIPLAGFWSEQTVPVEEGSDVDYFMTRPGLMLSFAYYVLLLIFLVFWGHWLNRKVFIRVVFSFECLGILGFSLLAGWAYNYNLFAAFGAENGEIWMLQGLELFLITPVLGVVCGTIDAMETSIRHKGVVNACILIGHIILYYYHRSLADLNNQRLWSDEQVCWLACGTPKSVYLMCKLMVMLFMTRSFVNYFYGHPFGFLHASYEIAPGVLSIHTELDDGANHKPPTARPTPLSEEALKKANEEAAPAVSIECYESTVRMSQAGSGNDDETRSCLVEAQSVVQAGANQAIVDFNIMEVPPPQGFSSAFTTSEAGTGTMTPPKSPRPRSRINSVGSVQVERARGSSNGEESDFASREDTLTRLAAERAKRENLELEIEVLVAEASQAQKWKNRARGLERELYETRATAAASMQQLQTWDMEIAAERQYTNDIHDALIAELDNARDMAEAEWMQRFLLFQRLQALDLQCGTLSATKSAVLGEAILRSRMKAFRSPRNKSPSSDGSPGMGTEPEDDADLPSIEDSSVHLYIAQLPNSVDEAMVIGYFKSYGQVVGVVLAEGAKTSDGGESFQSCVVSFQDVVSVQRVMEMAGRHKIGGCRLVCMPTDFNLVKVMRKVKSNGEGPVSGAATTAGGDSLGTARSLVPSSPAPGAEGDAQRSIHGSCPSPAPFQPPRSNALRLDLCLDRQRARGQALSEADELEHQRMEEALEQASMDNKAQLEVNNMLSTGDEGFFTFSK